MILFKHKIFSIRLRMILTHLIFFAVILFFFSCSVLHTGLCSTKSAIAAAILFLTLEQIFNNFFFNHKLNVKDDEFLRYKYCKTSAANLGCGSCHVDALLDIIFENSPDLITFKDSKLRYAMCSKKFIPFAGIKDTSEIIGKTPKDLFPSEQANLILKFNNLVLKEGTTQTFLLTCNMDDELEHKYEVISAPIISNNEVVGILTLSRDVTDALNLNEALAFSNSKLQDLLNNSPMLAYIIDTEGNFLLGNDRANNLFINGVDITFSGEKNYFDINEFKAEIMKEDCNVLANNVNMQYERQFIAKNGEKYWYFVHKTPLRHNDGKIYAISTFASCIEKEKRMAEQRETYIATLSHDLKTPTIAQVRALELLLSGQLGYFNEEQKEMLKLTLDSCNYMYDMVYTLLSTYKFENGDITLNYSSFDVVKMIKESIHEISNLTAENKVTIQFDDRSELFVDADKIELKRVIINLLSNAINYAYKTTEVMVVARKCGKNLEVRVQNSSPYIEPDALADLFRKYVTHSDKFNKVGIGLGLYLSKRIIEAHEGQIIAESSKKQRNTFGFLIPLKSSKAVANQVEML